MSGIRAGPGGGDGCSLAVVIPSFNRPEHLRLAVRSALRHRAFVEVIVVDDGSEPAVDLGDLAEPRLSVIRHASNRGVSAARNTGLARARASHIVFLDDDDTLLPFAGRLMLHWARRARRRQGTAAFAVGAVRVVRSDGSAYRRVPPSSEPGEIWGLDRHLLAGRRDFATKQAAVIPKALIESVGGWDEALESRVTTELFFRLTAVASVIGHRWPVYQLSRDTHAKLTADSARRERSVAHIRRKHRTLLVDPARAAAFEENHTRMMALNAAS